MPLHYCCDLLGALLQEKAENYVTLFGRMLELYVLCCDCSGIVFISVVVCLSPVIRHAVIS